MYKITIKNCFHPLTNIYFPTTFLFGNFKLRGVFFFLPLSSFSLSLVGIIVVSLFGTVVSMLLLVFSAWLFLISCMVRLNGIDKLLLHINLKKIFSMSSTKDDFFEEHNRRIWIEMLKGTEASSSIG